MRTVVLALILCGTATSSAFAAHVGVFPVRGTNVTEGEAAAIGALIAASYSAASREPVLGPAHTAPALAQAGSAPDAAQQLGLTEYVQVDAIRLDQRILVQATLYNVHGSPLYSTKTTAMSMDDMEVVSDRLTRSLIRRTPLEYTRELDNVTGKEARAPNRIFVEKVFGLRTAVVVPVASDLETTAGLMLQFDGRLEGSSYFLEFGAGIALPSDFDSDDGFGGVLAQIGASYYLTSTNVSPYVGGGFSPRLMFGDFTGAGLTANGQFGVMFMRQASSRLYVELRVDQNLLPLSRDTYDYDDYDYSTNMPRPEDEDDAVWPTEFSLAVGIGW